ncbi:MAG: endonuclease/exonuclease/phosphatase family protein [Ramlibacter sp.]
MRLVTWNCQWCCGLDGVVSPERIVHVARALTDFDVLCLQEVAVNYPRLRGNAGHDQPALVAGLLPGFQVAFGAAVDEWDAQDGHSRFGNLVATRLPLAQLQHHPLPYPADPGIESMPRMCTVATVLDPVLGPVRVMTTHLEFYSARQRMAQARAVRDLHRQACAQALAPPRPVEDGSPSRTKVHTTRAVVCGDFNLGPDAPEYPELTRPGAEGRLWDSWRLVHGEAARPPTFRVYDRTYGPDPIACDFVFVSDALLDHVRRIEVDTATQASDHQPVMVELA